MAAGLRQLVLLQEQSGDGLHLDSLCCLLQVLGHVWLLVCSLAQPAPFTFWAQPEGYAALTCSA